MLLALSPVGKCGTMTLEQQRQAVQNELNAQGYITSRAYINAQGQIAVVYGRIGKVILHDGSTPIPALKRYFFGMVLEGQVLNVQKLQAIVALYNKMSSNHVHMDIKPGKAPNTSDIVITNDYHFLWNLGLGYRYQDEQNFGYLLGSFQQPLGLNDVLSTDLYYNKHELYFDLTYQLKDLTFTINSKYHNQWLPRGPKLTPLNVSEFKNRYGLAYGKQFGVGQQSAMGLSSKIEYLHNKQAINVGTLNLQLRNVYYWNAYLNADSWLAFYQDKTGYLYFEINPQVKLGLIQGTTNGLYTNLTLDAALHWKKNSTDQITLLNDFSVKLYGTSKPNEQAPNDTEYQYSDADYGYSGFRAVVVRNSFRTLYQRGGWTIAPSLELNAAWNQKWVEGVGVGLSITQKVLVLSVQAGATTNGKKFVNATVGIQYPGE